MSLLLYAITDASLAAVTGGGVAGRPIEAVGEEGLVALVSEHTGPPRLTEASLWEFEDAIEAQMSDHAVLPARFGTMFADEHAIEAILSDRRAELSANLERVRGAVELGVRATWRGAHTEPAHTGTNAGTSYLLARVERERRAHDIAAQIDGVLGQLARATSYRVLARPAVPVTAAYLVDRESEDELVMRVRELEGAIEGADLVCTGPWPPYSFVGSAGDD